MFLCFKNMCLEMQITTDGGLRYDVIDGLASVSVPENERPFLINKLGDILSELNDVFSRIRLYEENLSPVNMQIADLNSTWAAGKVEVISDLPKGLVPDSQIISIENGPKFVSAQCHPDILKIFYNIVFNMFDKESQNIIRQVCIETVQPNEMFTMIKKNKAPLEHSEQREDFENIESSKAQFKIGWQYFFDQEKTVNVDLTGEGLDKVAALVRSILGKMITVYRELRMQDNSIVPDTDLFENILVSTSFAL